MNKIIARYRMLKEVILPVLVFIGKEIKYLPYFIPVSGFG